MRFVSFVFFVLFVASMRLAWAGDVEPRKDIRPVRDGLACLRATYGAFIKEIQSDPGTRKTRVVMTDGTAVLWDDGISDKSFDRKLDSADLQDTFSIPYPKGRIFPVPEKDGDPGRIRVDKFFKSVYGRSGKEVMENLVEVPWLPDKSGQKLLFNCKNNAADALRKVSADLGKMPDRMLKYVAVSAGTFSRRKIAGTRRLSAHAYGIAIDIDARYADYWRWAMGREPSPRWKNRIPLEIVEIFEKHGFIWGGKWYHYDTMHFEYRPELLATDCGSRVP